MSTRPGELSGAAAASRPAGGARPTFSVVIPTYHGRKDYVVEAARSALTQVLPDGTLPEVIVVDDGGQDGTEAAMRALSPAIVYVWQENQREGAARNHGARLARGRYIGFLDSDDAYLPGKLAADVARFLCPDQPALVYGRAVNVDQDGKPLGTRLLPTPQGDVFFALARESFIPMSSVAVDADRFRDIRGFREDRDLSGTADWECWLRIAARWTVGFTGEPARTAIRVHPRNMLGDTRSMERAMLAGVRYASADPEVARRLGQRKRRLLSYMAVTIALNAYGNGLRRHAAAWLVRSLMAWPGQALDARFARALVGVALGPAAARQVARRLTWLRSGAAGPLAEVR